MIRDKGDIVLRHEVEMNPVYELERDRLRASLTALSSVLVVPITYKGELRGLIGLGRKKSGKLFTREDLDLLRTITYQSAIALENATLFNENLTKSRMEEELKIAHEIQANMLPERAPDIQGIEITARSLPAREVGGDFYDFIEMGETGRHDRLGIVVGDVSGKGVSAALMMAASRSTYRVLLQSDPPISELMRTANQRLHSDIKRGMFVALLYAVFDGSERVLTVANAGQTEPIICPSGGKPAFYSRRAATGSPSASCLIASTKRLTFPWGRATSWSSTPTASSKRWILAARCMASTACSPRSTRPRISRSARYWSMCWTTSGNTLARRRNMTISRSWSVRCDEAQGRSFTLRDVDGRHDVALSIFVGMGVRQRRRSSEGSLSRFRGQ